MTNWQTLVDDLWNGEKSICFFVHSGKCFWIIDDKFNFCLDAEKDYRAYRDKGHITQEQYTSACMSFRDGIIKLTTESFPKYLRADQRKILSPHDLNEVLTWKVNPSKSLHEKIENHYSFGAELSAKSFHDANTIASRLPMFYVNFDRKTYMHMDWHRTHEELAYSDWLAKCMDFCHLVPDRERYWTDGNIDLWKYRFLQPV